MRIVCIVVACVAAVSAQPQPVFRTSTRLVQVSVVVEGRDGRPVSGLTANDFRLYDGGQEQRIELFVTDSTVRADTRESVSSPANPPHEFSNRMASRRGATVVLLDRLNTPDTDQIYARQRLMSFLEQIREEDRIGLYILEGGAIHVLHDFTNDARLLLRALSRYRAMTSKEVADVPLPEFESTSDAALDAAMAAALERASANMTAHFNGLRSDATIDAFRTIANHLASIEGRKNLIWVTAGFPLQAFNDRGRDPSAAIQQAIRPLNDANVTLYAVDARGLMGAITLDPGGKAAFTTSSAVQTNQDIMRIAATETGGRAFLNTNDIGGAVRRAVDDTRISYTLGYYPSHGKWDGKYREIKVQVNRPGMQIRHRRGYLAATGSQRVSSSAAVRSALASPLEASGLELTARIERLAAPNDFKISIVLAPGAVAFVPSAGLWKGQLDLVVAQRLADGSAPKSVDQTFDLSLRQDRYDEALKRGFTISAQVTLLPGAHSLHIVVHDVTSGTTGSVIVSAKQLGS
jgi:VWFA-related protein